MNNYLSCNRIFMFAAMLLITACCNDDGTITETVTTNSISPLTIVSLSNANKYTQVDIFEEGIVSEINLTNELQLNETTNYFTTFYNAFIAFYTPFEDQLNVKQKNLFTGSVNTLNEFCVTQVNETPFRLITNGNTYARLGFDAITNGRLLHLDIYNSVTGLPCSRIDIADTSTLQNIDLFIDTVEAYNNYVLVSYADELDNNYLAIIDLDVEQVVHQFMFNTTISNSFIYNNDIYIATSTVSNYKVYGMSNFQFKRNFELPPNLYVAGDANQPNIYQNQIVFETSAIQPSAFVGFPTLVDIETAEVLFTFSDLSSINNKVNAWIADNIPSQDAMVYRGYNIDIANSTLIFSYYVSSNGGNTESGVIAYSDFSGDITSFISIPVDPQKIILR